MVGGETRFAYFPATAVSDGTVSVQAATDPTLTQAGGESLLTKVCKIAQVLFSEAQIKLTTLIYFRSHGLCLYFSSSYDVVWWGLLSMWFYAVEPEEPKLKYLQIMRCIIGTYTEQ